MSLNSVFTVCNGRTLSTRWSSLPAGSCDSTDSILRLRIGQLISRLQHLESTCLIFAVRGGGQLVEEDVGVAAANLAGGHWAHPGVVVAVPLPQPRVPAVGRVMASQSVPRVVGYCIQVIHSTLTVL